MRARSGIIGNMQSNTPSLARYEAFHDPQTGTVSYLVFDASTRRAAIVDPVLDYDAKSGHTDTSSATRLLDTLEREGLGVDWILETHAHADHLSAARWLQERVGGRIAIGEPIRQVQKTFKTIYNLEREFLPDGSQFDHLFVDGERFSIGTLQAQAIWVPGHTPADMAYLISDSSDTSPTPGGDLLLAGDTLFMPDLGSARADFPGGDAPAQPL